MTKFYVELPRDKQGNRSYTNSRPAVLEIQSVMDGTLDVHIVAPEFHAKQRKTIPAKQVIEHFIEVEGPAREITEGEREAMIVTELMRRIP